MQRYVRLVSTACILLCQIALGQNAEDITVQAISASTNVEAAKAEVAEWINVVQKTELGQSQHLQECLKSLAYKLRTAHSEADFSDLIQELEGCRHVIETPFTDTRSTRAKLWFSINRLRRLMLDQQRSPKTAAARKTLLQALHSHRSGVPLDVDEVSEAYMWLKDRAMETGLTGSIKPLLNNPNLSIVVSSDLFRRLVVRRINEPATVQSQLNRIRLTGCGRAIGEVKLRLQPCDAFAMLDLVADTNVSVQTRSSRGPATVHSDSRTRVVASRPLSLDQNGLSILGPTTVKAVANVRPTRVDTRRRLGSKIISRIAYRKANQLAPDSRQLAIRESTRKIVPQFESESSATLSKFNQQIVSVRQTLDKLDAYPESMRFLTTSTSLNVQVRYEGGLGISTNRHPVTFKGSDVQISIHQSLINNYVANVLRNRRFPPDRESIAKLLPSNMMALNGESDTDNQRYVVLDDSKPIVIRFDSGILRLGVSGVWYAPGLPSPELTVTAQYRPMIRGQEVLLKPVQAPLILESARLSNATIEEKIRPHISKVFRREFSAALDDLTSSLGLSISMQPNYLSVHEGWLSFGFNVLYH